MDGNNRIELELNDDGILRKNGGNCDITFTNFGMNDHIKNIKIYKIPSSDNVHFNLKIKNLINGNIGPNNSVHLNSDVLKGAIKILQDGNEFQLLNFISLKYNQKLV